MTKFRNEIILYSLIMAAVAEVVSLIVIGPNITFVLGLLIGTAVAIVGFIILVKTGQMLMDDKKKKPVVLGYVLRIFLYGISFLTDSSGKRRTRSMIGLREPKNGTI